MTTVTLQYHVPMMVRRRGVFEFSDGELVLPESTLRSTRACTVPETTVTLQHMLLAIVRRRREFV